MKAIVKYYKSLDDMPAMTRQAVRTMGYADGGYLRQVATNSDRYTCHGAIIIYEAGTPVGWTALYAHTSRRTIPCYQIGVWIRTRHRKKGYGVKLIKSAYKRWRILNPQAFNSVETIWNAFDIVNKLKNK